MHKRLPGNRSAVDLYKVNLSECHRLIGEARTWTSAPECAVNPVTLKHCNHLTDHPPSLKKTMIYITFIVPS